MNCVLQNARSQLYGLFTRLLSNATRRQYKSIFLILTVSGIHSTLTVRAIFMGIQTF